MLVNEGSEKLRTPLDLESLLERIVGLDVSTMQSLTVIGHVGVDQARCTASLDEQDAPDSRHVVCHKPGQGRTGYTSSHND